ncbi:MAG: glycosyltransferase family 4 protein [Pyrinomonadaceae bacterium]
MKQTNIDNSPVTKIIYAWNYLEWGGAQIYFLALIKEARKQFEIVVACPEGSSPQFLRFLDDLDVRYELFPTHVDTRSATTLTIKVERHITKFRNEYEMLRHIEKIGLENAIVHIEILPHQSLSSLVWLCLKTRVFVTSHNAMAPAPYLREKLWKLKCRAISHFKTFNVLCSNEDAKSYFGRYYSSAVNDRTEVTYTSINPPEIDEALSSDMERQALCQQFGLSSDGFNVLAVGQFIDRKGRWTFLEAAKRVLADHPDVQFIWMTPTLPDETDVRRINSGGLGDSFKILLSSNVGSNRKDILRFFRIADTFALPSFVEGLPIALLEAMALGIPSISTNVNGIPEAVKNGETGLLVEAGDAGALAAAIVRFKTDAALRLLISKNGRSFVIKHFDERVAARTAVRAYQRALFS